MGHSGTNVCPLSALVPYLAICCIYLCGGWQDLVAVRVQTPAQEGTWGCWLEDQPILQPRPVYWSSNFSSVQNHLIKCWDSSCMSALHQTLWWVLQACMIRGHHIWNNCNSHTILPTHLCFCIPILFLKKFSEVLEGDGRVLGLAEAQSLAFVVMLSAGRSPCNNNQVFLHDPMPSLTSLLRPTSLAAGNGENLPGGGGGADAGLYLIGHTSFWAVWPT